LARALTALKRAQGLPEPSFLFLDSMILEKRRVRKANTGKSLSLIEVPGTSEKAVWISAGDDWKGAFVLKFGESAWHLNAYKMKGLGLTRP
jgi:hypothetical protein